MKRVVGHACNDGGVADADQLLFLDLLELIKGASGTLLIGKGGDDKLNWHITITHVNHSL
jgi:hypothetical protein